MDKDDKVLMYVQGRLTPEDGAALEAEMRTDADLRAEVQAMQATRVALAPIDVPDKDSGWSRLSAAIDAERAAAPANENRPIRLSLLQAASVVAASVVLWQLLAVPMITETSGPFTPATEAPDGPSVQIIFDETAVIAEITDLLSSVGGEIISGPGALGIYRVSFADEAALDAARAVLEARDELVIEVMVD